MITKEQLKKHIEVLGTLFKMALQQVMDSPIGINDKIGKNTLSNSNLYNQIDVQVEDINLVNVLVKHYIEFVESGRKPLTKKVPISVLNEWCIRKGINNDNSTLFKIQNSIYTKGISPRPIINDSFEELDNIFNSWSDELFEMLIDKLFE